VVWTASATCQLANPELALWVLDPISETWSVAAPYSAATTYTWTVPSVAAGSVYYCQVWTREAGSTANYEAWAGSSFTVAGNSPCASVSTTTSPSFVPGGTAVTLTSSAAGCPSAEYEVWYLPPGGSYQILQPYSASAATYVWDAPAAPGTYTFQVWARQPGSSATYDAWDNFSVTVTRPTVYATALPQYASVGTQVTISSSTGFSNPEYEVWHQPPGGSYELLQPYSASTSYVWDTTGETPGIHQFQVWARQQGDGNTYDGWTGFTYDLQAGRCSSVSTGTSSSSVAGGAAVTLTSSATGCSSPEYEVWFLPPGGSYQLLQSYSASAATYVWDAPTTPLGAYTFQVWARASGSNATYDAWDNFSVTVTAGP
jgi:hypothetical protein